MREAEGREAGRGPTMTEDAASEGLREGAERGNKTAEMRDKRRAGECAGYSRALCLSDRSGWLVSLVRT